MEETKYYKIELTQREFEILHEITQYAISKMEIYLMCLLRSEYGRDEAEIHRTSAKLVTFKIFQDMMTAKED